MSEADKLYKKSQETYKKIKELEEELAYERRQYHDEIREYRRESVNRVLSFVRMEVCEYLHYKDLEEKGRLIETPCEMRLGQKWFYIGFGIPIEFEIVDFGWWKTDGLGAYGYGDFPNMSKMFFPFSYFGKYVFLTKSEAERSRN